MVKFLGKELERDFGDDLRYVVFDDVKLKPPSGATIVLSDGVISRELIIFQCLTLPGKPISEYLELLVVTAVFQTLMQFRQCWRFGVSRVWCRRCWLQPILYIAFSRRVLPYWIDRTDTGHNQWSWSVWIRQNSFYPLE